MDSFSTQIQIEELYSFDVEEAWRSYYNEKEEDSNV